MPVNPEVFQPSSALDQTGFAPVEIVPISSLLNNENELYKPILADDLQDINRNLPVAIIATPIVLNEEIAITPNDEVTFGGLQFQRVIAQRHEILNFSSLDCLRAARNEVPAVLQQKIGALDRKRTNYSQKYPYEDYFSQCSLISMLEQSISAQVCFCGLKSANGSGINPTGLCNRPRLCKRCASANVQKTLQTFQPHFYQHPWGFLTMSYQGNLNFTHLSGDDWSLHWDAPKSALKRLVASNLVDGAMIREELAILSLSPSQVQPHLHAILSTDTLPQDSINLLTRWAVSYCDDAGNNVTLLPSIQFKAINGEDDFERVVQYLHKPIDLVSPYRARWRDNLGTEDKAYLNRSMRDLMEACITLPKGRAQIAYFGNLRASSNSFIGVPPRDRTKK